MPALCGDVENVLVRLLDCLFNDVKEVQGVVRRSFDFAFFQLSLHEAAEEGVEIEVEVLGARMCLLNKGFDQVGRAPCSCMEETKSTLFNFPVEEHSSGFEEQVLGYPLLDGGLDVVDILGPEVDDC